jgi:hypothetical protein
VQDSKYENIEDILIFTLQKNIIIFDKIIFLNKNKTTNNKFYMF